MRKYIIFASSILMVMGMITFGALPAAADGQAGTTLSATVNTTPHWTITYDWTIGKSVSPDTLELMSGESDKVTYTITVTKDNGTEEAWVEGQVCVTNGGAVATQNLAIEAVLQDGYGPPNDFLTSASVDVSGNPVLDPGETHCYDYRVDIPITGGSSPQPHSGGTYKVTANVTITNHSGHLGTPFGPSPSATTVFPSIMTLINDSIHLGDTNGGSWEFSDDGYVNYDKTFTCNEDSGEQVNRATIEETGQYDDATVTVNCTVPQRLLEIIKFYDANADGEYQPGEETEIEGWKVSIGSEIYYTWVHVNLDPGTYDVSEFTPIQANWLATTPTSVEVDLSETGKTVYFGNLCLGAGGGLTLGFWSNKNGQKLVGSEDLTMLIGLNLRNADGSDFDPANNTLFRTWLLSANATNMAYMLSAQLAAMELNVFNGKVDGTALIYAAGTTSANALGFATVTAIMAEANAELGLHGSTLAGSPYRAYQEALKDALDDANNNKYFVQSEPCLPITFPE